MANFAVMRKGIVLLALFGLALTFSAKAQYKWGFGGSVGVANYLGDIGGDEKTRRDFFYDLRLQKTRLNYGAFARMKWTPSLSFKTSFQGISIAGSDQLSSNLGRNSRNLSFRNNMFELSETAEYYFYKSSNASGRPGLRGSKKKVDFRTYLFAGVGLLYHNPQAQLNGEWVNLQPLQTEGVEYSKFQFVMPVGVGVAYTINRNHRIGFEFSWRVTFTDYLDDISTVYIDDAGMDQQTRDLYNRNPELWPSGLKEKIATNQPLTAAEKDVVELSKSYGYHPESTNGRLNKRGDPEHNDNFVTASLSYSYVLKGKNKFYKSKYKTLNQRRKVVKRKTRAKF